MNRIRLAGLCLVALFVLSAVAGGTASAAEPPELGRCLKVKGGKFTNSKCTAFAGGTKENYEWFPGPGPKSGFTTNASGLVVFETAAATKVICSGATGNGHDFTRDEGKQETLALTLTLTGCESGSLKCASAGQATGTIVTPTLTGEFGVTKVGETPAKNKVGVIYQTEGPLDFTCAGLVVSIKGSFIVPVKADSMLLTETQKLAQSKGEQNPDKLAGGPIDERILESSFAGGPFEETGLALAMVQTNEEKLEINTVV